MQLQGLSPSSVTFLCSLKACGTIGFLGTVLEEHTALLKRGFETELHMGNTLVDTYVKCGSLVDASGVFNGLPTQDAPSWAALISGYAELGLCEAVQNCFKQMELQGVSVDPVTFVRMLKACSALGALETGRKIHNDVKKLLLEKDLVGNTLVDMYIKCGSLVEAREVFDKLPARDEVSWNALIAGYAEHGPDSEVLNYYELMQREGVPPTDATFLCCLKTCGSLRDADQGHRLCSEIVKRGSERDLFVGSAIVDMLAKCGLLGEAQEVFDQMPARNIVSWTALIGGYADGGFGDEALKYFLQMQRENVIPVVFTFPCCLKACGIIGAVQIGLELHREIVKKGYESDLSVANALIDMYANCGSLAEGQGVFDKYPMRDVVSWTAMIRAYGDSQKGHMAVHCFEDMRKHGVKPNAITFTCLLAACSHVSLVLAGHKYFKMMKEEYAIKPSSDHYACMIDLLARSGDIYQAARFIEAMQCPPSKEILRALLTACKIHGKVQMGLGCFQLLVQHSQDDAAAYLLMAEIYRSAGMCNDAYMVEEMRNHAGATKKPANASIEVEKHQYDFIVGDSLSLDTILTFEVLILHVKCEGHVPNIDMVW